MRRKDRERDRQFALEVIDRCEYGTAAFAGEGGAGCRVRIGNTVIELTKNRESGEISADPR